MLLLEQLRLGVVGAGQPGVGGDQQVEPAAVEDVGEDAADRRRLAVQAGRGGDVAELAAAQVLEQSAHLRPVTGDEQVVQAVAVHVAEGAAQAVPARQSPRPPRSAMSVKVPSRLLRKR